MKKILTAEESKNTDKYTINSIGIPEMVLMERAALSVASLIMHNHSKNKIIMVVAGIGNNGADGLAVSRLLHLRGYKVCVFIMGDVNKATDGFKKQMDIIKNVGVNIINEYIDADIIVDALFGVGLSRDIEGLHKELIEEINKSNAYVYAVDIPSGIDASTGKVMAAAVKADSTVTFGFHKIGTALYPGAEYCGDVKVADIGLCEDNNVSDFIEYAGEEELKKIPKRQNYSNKGTYGKVLIVAGSKDISGAAVLSALAAFRTGAGMVRVFTHENNRAVIARLIPEAMINTYNLDNFDMKALGACIKWCDVAAIGPGIGTGSIQTKMVEQILDSKIPTVLDADAINTIARNENIKNKLHNKVVITPHVGEMSRFMANSIEDITDDLIKAARYVNYKYGITVVLKDARTVIVNNKGTYINLSGNSGMATAGSGDALCGIIIALIGMNTGIEEASVLGPYIHGCAGDKALKKHTKSSMMATDIINEIANVMKTV